MDKIQAKYEQYVTEKRERFYYQMLDMKVSLGKVKIPEAPVTFPLLPLVVHRGIYDRFHHEPLEGLFEVCKSNFGVCKQTKHSLDQISYHARHPRDGSYAILTPNRVEACTPPRILAAASGRITPPPGMTLLERLLLELYQHWRGVEGWDRITRTFCEGSSKTGSSTPVVGGSMTTFEIQFVSSSVTPKNAFVRHVWI